MPEPTCSIDECNKKVQGRGWCTGHYRRWRLYGDPTHVPPRPERPCGARGCPERGTAGQGFCQLHYQRWKAHGTTERVTPEGGNRYDVVDLLTGRLTIVRTDGSEHAYLYDLADHDLVAAYRWYRNPGGYAASSTGTRRDKRTFLLHRLLLGLPHGDPRFGDHINGDRADNRRENLRVADAKLNAANQAIVNDAGTSQYRGVCWATRQGKWKAYAHVDGRLRNLGFFTTEREAADVVIAFRAANHADSGYLRRHPTTPIKGRRGRAAGHAAVPPGMETTRSTA